MNKINTFSLLLICIVLFSCSKEESKYLEESTEISTDTEIARFNIKNNRWIYTQMDENYFWRKDMPDSVSLNFNVEPSVFFKKLLSKKDRFSWCEINSNYKGGSSAYYAALPDEIGFEYQTYQDLQHNIIYEVLYVTREDVLSAGIARGDMLKVVSCSGDSYTFEKGNILDNVFVAATENKDITVSLHSVSALSQKNETVYLDSIYTKGAKKIGYLVYLGFKDNIDLLSSFKYFKQNNIDELILDLRYNPGGYVSTCAFLAALIVWNNALGKPFQLQEYNDKISSWNYENYGDSIEVVNISNSNIAVQNNVNLRKLYVLTSNNTASASEALIIGLRPYMDVVVIGDVTYGKGVGSYTIANSLYKYQLQPITFRYFNALHQTVPDEGLNPDYSIKDHSYSKSDLGNENEPLLYVSLSIISGNSISGASLKASVSDSSRLVKIGDASFVRKFKERNVYY